MKIELVGGPECGIVREVKYADPELEFGGARYRRRDRDLNLAGGAAQCYGEKGHRMYDVVKA